MKWNKLGAFEVIWYKEKRKEKKQIFRKKKVVVSPEKKEEKPKKRINKTEEKTWINHNYQWAVVYLCLISSNISNFPKKSLKLKTFHRNHSCAYRYEQSVASSVIMRQHSKYKLKS